MEGTSVGPYRLVSRIGAGGMGVVWLAGVEDAVPGVPIGERVALKIVHSHLVADANVFERFVHEASIGRAIRHENVVRTLDAGMDATEAGDVVYLAMEHVEGRTLAAVRRDGPVAEGLVRRVAREAARGLRAIHDAGVVHGDVKPENLVLTRDEVVKLMDLGLARLRDAAPRNTSGGGFCGTLLYAAPEQFGNRPDALDGRIDLFALGATLYELAAGRHPWARDDDRGFVPRQLDTDAPRLRSVRPEATEFLETVVQALLERDPARRIGSAAELTSILLAAEEGPWFRARRGSGGARGSTSLPPVRGRESELAALWRLVRAAAGGRGGTALVEGDPASGKSLLTATLAEAARAAGLALDHRSIRLAPGHDGPAAVEGLAAPANADRPRLLVVEGAGHADDHAWSALVDASRRAARSPLALVLTSAAPLPLVRRESLIAAGRIALGPLPDEALADIASDVLVGGRAGHALVRWLAERSGGNAGVARAWTEHCVASHALRTADDGTWTPRTVPDTAPAAVVAWGEAALTALAAEDRELLEVCACAGRDFDAALVSSVAGLDAADVEARCGVLARTGVVRRHGGTRWTFAAATHAALVTGVSEALRPEYARAFADVLAGRATRSPAESADLVRHLVAAGETSLPPDDVRAAVAHLDATGRTFDVLALAEIAAADEFLARDAVLWRARALLDSGLVSDARAALAAKQAT